MANRIMGKKSKRHITQDLIGDSDKPYAKEKGWMQFYFEGSLNPGGAHKIFKIDVSQQEHKACK